MMRRRRMMMLMLMLMLSGVHNPLLTCSSLLIVYDPWRCGSTVE